MATRTITSADNGACFALHDSATTIELDGNMGSHFKIRFVHVTSLDSQPKLIQAKPGLSIRGWIPNVEVTEFYLYTDGDAVELMFDELSNVWQIVARVIPPKTLVPL